jgi:hypothetical protein
MSSITLRDLSLGRSWFVHRLFALLLVAAALALGSCGGGGSG